MRLWKRLQWLASPDRLATWGMERPFAGQGCCHVRRGSHSASGHLLSECPCHPAGVRICETDLKREWARFGLPRRGIRNGCRTQSVSLGVAYSRLTKQIPAANKMHFSAASNFKKARFQPQKRKNLHFSETHVGFGCIHAPRQRCRKSLRFLIKFFSALLRRRCRRRTYFCDLESPIPPEKTSSVDENRPLRLFGRCGFSEMSEPLTKQALLSMSEILLKSKKYSHVNFMKQTAYKQFKKGFETMAMVVLISVWR